MADGNQVIVPDWMEAFLWPNMGTHELKTAAVAQVRRWRMNQCQEWMRLTFGPPGQWPDPLKEAPPETHPNWSPKRCVKNKTRTWWRDLVERAIWNGNPNVAEEQPPPGGDGDDEPEGNAGDPDLTRQKQKKRKLGKEFREMQEQVAVLQSQLSEIVSAMRQNKTPATPKPGPARKEVRNPFLDRLDKEAPTEDPEDGDAETTAKPFKKTAPSGPRLGLENLLHDKRALEMLKQLGNLGGTDALTQARAEGSIGNSKRYYVSEFVPKDSQELDEQTKQLVWDEEEQALVTKDKKSKKSITVADFFIANLTIRDKLSEPIVDPTERALFVKEYEGYVVRIAKHFQSSTPASVIKLDTAIRNEVFYGSRAWRDNFSELCYLHLEKKDTSYSASVPKGVSNGFKKSGFQAIASSPPQRETKPCFADNSPGGCQNPNCKFVHKKTEGKPGPPRKKAKASG